MIKQINCEAKSLTLMMYPEMLFLVSFESVVGLNLNNLNMIFHVVVSVYRLVKI